MSIKPYPTELSGAGVLNMRTCIRVHTQTRARTHAQRAHTPVQTRMRARTYAQPASMRAHARTRSHAQARARTMHAYVGSRTPQAAPGELTSPRLWSQKAGLSSAFAQVSFSTLKKNEETVIPRRPRLRLQVHNSREHVRGRHRLCVHTFTQIRQCCRSHPFPRRPGWLSGFRPRCSCQSTERR